mmetsp:Transcript_3641/g.7996  ORF Transcript_3641/g.7996 Transcript_3641/m.7996 type:complete len:83 (+) Transcript_3641:240-488(+)
MIFTAGCLLFWLEWSHSTTDIPSLAIRRKDVLNPPIFGLLHGKSQPVKQRAAPKLCTILEEIQNFLTLLTTPAPDYIAKRGK